jgi:uncharacterized membrane protein YeaQ/YmgE (transglycosylase-associated protein family)
MGIVGWIVLGIALGAIASAAGPVRPDHGRLEGSVAGLVGAVAGGLIGAAAGLGSVGTFFTVGTWVTAAGGAFLAIELVRYGATRRLRAPEVRERDVRQAGR